MENNKFGMRCFSADIGLTGFISIIDFDYNYETEEIDFNIVDSLKIEVEERNKNLLLISSKKEDTKAIIKNQISFIKNQEIVDYYITEDKKNIIGLFENVKPLFNNSKISMMSLADSASTFRCIFESLDIDYLQINPSVWKSFLNLSSDKKESKDLYYKLVSENKIKTNNKGIKLEKIKNHNQIESILIAYFYFKR